MLPMPDTRAFPTSQALDYTFFVGRPLGAVDQPATRVMSPFHSSFLRALDKTLPPLVSRSVSALLVRTGPGSGREVDMLAYA